MVTSLRYLGSVISAVDDDCKAMVRNLAKVRVVWRSMTRILIKEKARLRVSIFYFKSIVKLVLLFGA